MGTKEIDGALKSLKGGNAENLGVGHDLAMALRRAYLTMHRETNARLAARGLTADQFVLLAALADPGPMSQRELVERTASDPNTVSGMLGRLEERGLVRRSISPEDKRVRVTSLTAKGRAAQEGAIEDTVDLRAAMAGCFGDGELKKLVELLGRIPGGCL